MKRIFLAFALLAGMTLLSGCFGNNNDPKPTEYDVTTGALVLSAGNPILGHPSSLSYIDLGENHISDHVFIPDGGSFGDLPNDVMIYGGKVYVAGSGQNTVFVFDKKTHKPVKTISTTGEMGDEKGVHPRRFAPYRDRVFVTTQSGYVGVIDTLSLSIKNMYQVGYYPEGMSIGMKDDVPYLHVANSGGDFEDGSISIINLSSGAVSELKNERISHPLDLAVAGEDIYVLDRSGVFYVTGSNVYSLIPNAAGMYAVGYNLLTYNTPGSPGADPTYTLYNLNYDALSSFYLSGDDSCPIVNPTAICIDSNSGYVMIGAQTEGSQFGYVNLYTGGGLFVASFKTGYCPIRIAFIHETVEM